MMRFAASTRSTVIALLLVLPAALLGCGKGPTGADEAVENTFDTSPTIANTAGAPTIVEAEFLLDGRVIDDEAEAGDPVASLQLITPGFPAIGGGAHTLQINLLKQTTSVPTSYTIPKFGLSLIACSDGSFSDDGSTGNRAYTFPKLTTDLVAGQGFTYTFTTPDCTQDFRYHARTHTVSVTGTGTVPPVRR